MPNSFSDSEGDADDVGQEETANAQGGGDGKFFLDEFQYRFVSVKRVAELEDEKTFPVSPFENTFGKWGFRVLWGVPQERPQVALPERAVEVVDFPELLQMFRIDFTRFGSCSSQGAASGFREHSSVAAKHRFHLVDRTTGNELDDQESDSHDPDQRGEHQ